MSRQATKTNNDAAMFASKVELRLESLPPEKTLLNVLDCFGGEGLLWSKVREARPEIKFNVLSIDKNRYKKINLQGENTKFIKSLDLSNFDIIDLDAWGTPIEQLELLGEKKYTGIVHCTFIQTMQGALPQKLLSALGYPPNMVKKCPSLFNRDGIGKFLAYLGAKGVEKVRIITEKRKNYLYFYLDKPLIMNNL